MTLDISDIGMHANLLWLSVLNRQRGSPPFLPLPHQWSLMGQGSLLPPLGLSMSLLCT